MHVGNRVLVPPVLNKRDFGRFVRVGRVFDVSRPSTRPGDGYTTKQTESMGVRKKNTRPFRYHEYEHAQLNSESIT